MTGLIDRRALSTRPRASPDGAAHAAVFVDVDETLVRVKSLLAFLDYHQRVTHAARSACDAALASLLREAACQPPETARAWANRAFYHLLRGERVDQLAAEAQDWFAEEVGRGGFFHDVVHAEVVAHRARGRPLILVSGSFRACLDPIAASLDAEAILCSQPTVRCGVYTGESDVTMIGAVKALAAAQLIEAWDLDARHCFAYGDDASDLALLNLVGHATVIGDDSVLARHALDGWRRIPRLASPS